jgi:HSP20 family protein
MDINNLVPWMRGEKQVPVRRGAQEPVFQLKHRLDHLFDDFFESFDRTPFEPFGESFGAFSPRVDVSENDEEIKVTAELPGLDEDDIEVSLAHNLLTVSGEKQEEVEDNGKNFYRMERSYGSFRRTIPLPVEVEADKVKAKFKKGILTVTLPKTAEAQRQARRIPIKTG